MSLESLGVVIPCYNEENRLPVEDLLRLAEQEGVEILLVNDGSKDRTEELLKSLSLKAPSVQFLNLEQNSGKAEAVRQGLNELLKKDYKWVAYLDADFATPLSEIKRIFKMRDQLKAKVVLGSRVRLLGYRIHRKMHRHYLGRVFATFASMTLGIPVYDTQCGFKMLRVTDGLKTSLQEPFRTRWVFDVELIFRILRIDPEAADYDRYFEEIPLRSWKDVGGSKLSLKQMIGAFKDLMLLSLRS